MDGSKKRSLKNMKTNRSICIVLTIPRKNQAFDEVSKFMLFGYTILNPKDRSENLLLTSRNVFDPCCRYVTN